MFLANKRNVTREYMPLQLIQIDRKIDKAKFKKSENDREEETMYKSNEYCVMR